MLITFGEKQPQCLHGIANNLFRRREGQRPIEEPFRQLALSEEDRLTQKLEDGKALAGRKRQRQERRELFAQPGMQGIRVGKRLLGEPVATTAEIGEGWSRHARGGGSAGSGQACRQVAGEDGRIDRDGRGRPTLTFAPDGRREMAVVAPARDHVPMQMRDEIAQARQIDLVRGKAGAQHCFDGGDDAHQARLLWLAQIGEFAHVRVPDDPAVTREGAALLPADEHDAAIVVAPQQMTAQAYTQFTLLHRRNDNKNLPPMARPRLKIVNSSLLPAVCWSSGFP